MRGRRLTPRHARFREQPLEFQGEVSNHQLLVTAAGEGAGAGDQEKEAQRRASCARNRLRIKRFASDHVLARDNARHTVHTSPTRTSIQATTFRRCGLRSR